MTAVSHRPLATTTGWTAKYFNLYDESMSSNCGNADLARLNQPASWVAPANCRDQDVWLEWDALKGASGVRHTGPVHLKGIAVQGSANSENRVT